MTAKTDQRLRLNIAQLEVFVAIARLGSTRTAAERIGRSQSAVSDALAELEGTLNAQLFDRVGRRLVLNEQGRELLPRAAAFLSEAGEIETLFNAHQVATLHMAASYTIGEYLLPDLIGQWKAGHPHARVHLEIANTSRVLDAVAAFDVDLGFIEGSGTHPDLMVQRWRDDRLVIVAAPDHPFVGKRVSLRRLADATWIVRERGSGTREATDRWLIDSLGRMLVELELGSNEAVKRAVASGLGLGCLSSFAVAGALARGELVELVTPLPLMNRVFSIVVHRQRSLGRTARAFIQHVRLKASMPVTGIRRQLRRTEP
ncbi:MAG: LysR family transcriptional regulator [Comamonadaceae bacterium]|uniref:LysR family transcriptional regulator n=1 Tax=Candidatus Skiveiella danica TaxID=3386177 RepID=UPI000CA32FA1|nr:LysR family transcriptional regulator YeiE [uncultured bacterium]MBK8359304.1 LysR family transcriptional regulator [Comamonadaceae bacterium]MBP7573217.1 LysR family transcriptional regulator [Rhodoferax sp.]MCA8937778.1 LysR family transcriptional regulator [Planctomycetota bacterium]